MPLGTRHRAASSLVEKSGARWGGSHPLRNSLPSLAVPALLDGDPTVET